MPLKQLSQLSQQIGALTPFWTQGAGGNISVKQGDVMYIKASGVRLDQVHENSGIAALRLSVLLEGLKQTQENRTLSTQDQEKAYFDTIGKSSLQGRPSMEAGFHGQIKSQWVIHFHSLAAILMAHHHQVKDPRFETFKSTVTLPISWVAYATPGWALTQRISEAPTSSIYILENHGVVLAGDDPQILELWKEIESLFLDQFYPEKVRTWRSATTEQIEASLPPIHLEPFPIYLPDTAVFAKDISAWLHLSSTELSASPSNEVQLKNRGLKELVVFTKMLRHACPKLAVLPNQEAQNLPQLPTEVFRQKGQA